jgi:hypothetical protein
MGGLSDGCVHFNLLSNRLKDEPIIAQFGKSNAFFIAKRNMELGMKNR